MADPQRRLRSVDLTKSHPVLSKFLKGGEILDITEEKTAELFAVYVSLLPVRRERLSRQPPPGNLKRQAYYQVRRGGFGDKKDRWMGYVGNTADYAAIVEYGKNGSAGRHDLENAAKICGYNTGGHDRRTVRTNVTKEQIRRARKNPKPTQSQERETRRLASLEKHRADRNEKKRARAEQGARRYAENLERQRQIGRDNTERKAERKRQRELERDPRERYKRERAARGGVKKDDNAGTKSLTTEEKIDRFFKLAKSKDKKAQKEAVKLRLEIQKEQALKEIRNDTEDEEAKYERLIAKREKDGKNSLSALDNKFIRQFEDG